MRVFQSHPDNQLAFVLNLEQHWFTLRRFGHKHGKGFWFNLNSFLSAPEWVGSTYLGMVLEQAEREGYSVFVVRPADASNPEHGLPDTEADLLAETLNDSAQDAPRPPQGFSLAGSTGTGGRLGISGGGEVGGSSSNFGGTAGTERNAAGIAQRSERSSVPGLEDEDVELQRALQASLAGAASGGGVVYDFPDESGSSGTVPGGYGSTSGFGSSTGYGGSVGFGPSGAGLGLGYGGDRPPSRRTPPGAFPASALAPASDPPTPTNEPSSSSSDADPVAASAARARARLEQAQREQAAAMHGFGFGAGMDEAVDEEGARRRREAADRVRRAREEEEDQIRLAMAESLRTHSAGVEEGDPEYFVTPPSTTQSSLPGSFPTGGDRHYDDEDAELQAALRASLEEATSSSSGPAEQVLPPPRPAAPASVPERVVVPGPQRIVPVNRAPVPGAPVPASEDEDEEDEEEEGEEEKTPAPAPKAEVADAEEMRRRRLARFGG
ncbi:hypothetical protein FRC12_024000 [Ceratobasidium sp. 428]|nr:hypothetical protein FRC12_024000 [Ceratobasidium sp. 428]